MQFTIAPPIFERYPDLLVGILALHDVDNGSAHPEILSLLLAAEAKVRGKIPDAEALKQYPVIASWQEAHKKFGNNPNKYPPSLQALLKRVVKGGELPSINPLVDLYNVISLRYILNVGGEDLDQCVGDIQLSPADGTEPFIELGGTENTPPEPGEIVYKDDAGVICRKFNWREGERTKLTADTKNAVLVIEGLPPTQSENIERALGELGKLVQKYCGGTGHSVLLDRTTTFCELHVTDTIHRVE